MGRLRKRMRAGRKLATTTLTTTRGAAKESGLQKFSFVPFLAFTLVNKLVLNCLILGIFKKQFCNFVR